jgi:type I restriction enzyme S subunit
VGLRVSRYALVRKAVAQKGQLLLTVKGSGVGKTTICDIPAVAISRQLMAITPILWRIGFLSLVTHRLAERLQEQARSLIPGIAREDVEGFAFGLPPLAEQHRIVAKVDELMVLCDRLEEARQTREETRDRLTAASLARLTAPETTDQDFPTHARFALDTLPALTHRPDQIKALRQTILSLAVRGKLVAQDLGEGSGQELLNKVMAIPWRKKRKASDLEPDEAAMASSFHVPRNWAWATVEALTRRDQTVTYGILKPEWDKEGVPTVRVTEMKTGEIDVSVLPKCRPERAAKFAKTTLEAGDLLVS